MNDHPWIKRGPYPGPEHTGMPIPDDPIVGHATFRDGHHEPIRQSEAEAIIAESDRETALRAQQMPDERAAIDTFFNAWLRLKELGWREAQYCPKDGQPFDVIEAGSTGIHRCRYEGQWPTGSWWIVGDDDLYPSRPVLFRPLPDPPIEGHRSAAQEKELGAALLPVDPSAAVTTEPLPSGRCVMDYPTAWAFIREQHPDPKEHHPRCSWVQAKGGILCDCDVINNEYPNYILDKPNLSPSK